MKMRKRGGVEVRSNQAPSNYTKGLLNKGLLLPLCRSVCLMVVLCLGLSYAQPQEVSAPQNSPQQSTANPVPNGQVVPSPSPASSTASAPAGLQRSSGLNSLQGLKVAMIQVNGPGINDAESLLTILPQKVNEPLDRYKVRQSVQALYNTGRFAEIQVEAQRNPAGEIVLAFDARENYFFC